MTETRSHTDDTERVLDVKDVFNFFLDHPNLGPLGTSLFFTVANEFGEGSEAFASVTGPDDFMMLFGFGVMALAFNFATFERRNQGETTQKQIITDAVKSIMTAAAAAWGPEIFGVAISNSSELAVNLIADGVEGMLENAPQVAAEAAETGSEVIERHGKNLRNALFGIGGILSTGLGVKYLVGKAREGSDFLRAQRLKIYKQVEKYGRDKQLKEMLKEGNIIVDKLHKAVHKDIEKYAREGNPQALVADYMRQVYALATTEFDMAPTHGSEETQIQILQSRYKIAFLTRNLDTIIDVIEEDNISLANTLTVDFALFTSSSEKNRIDEFLDLFYDLAETVDDE